MIRLAMIATLMILGITWELPLALANMECNPGVLGEAQIIAKVGSATVQGNSNRCLIEIDATTIKHFQESRICPLDLDPTVLKQGIMTGIQNGHDCAMQTGDDVNGVLVHLEDHAEGNGIIVLTGEKQPYLTEKQECAVLTYVWGEACTGSGNYGEVYQGCLVPISESCPRGWTARVLGYGLHSSAICGRSQLKLIRKEPSGC